MIMRRKKGERKTERIYETRQVEIIFMFADIFEGNFVVLYKYLILSWGIVFFQ